MVRTERKSWATPAVKSLSIKEFTLGGPSQSGMEGTKPGKGLGGGSGPGASS